MERSHLTKGSYVRAALTGNSAHGVSTDRPDWRDEAQCQTADPETFFPEQGAGGAAQTREALEICRQCPVDYECWWDQVLAGDEAWGIRGGQRPASLNRSIEAFQDGGTQRPEVEAKQRAEQDRADRQAAQQAERQQRQQERDAAKARAAEDRQAKAREWDRNYRERMKEKLADPEFAAEYNASRAEYLAGREERQRAASRKYATAKRAREREEREYAGEIPEQRQHDQDVAEVA